VARREIIWESEAFGNSLGGCTALLLTADRPPYELCRWANEACARARVPLMTAAQQPPLLRIGPTYLAGDGPCFGCHERQLRRDFPLYDELAEDRIRNPPEGMSLGPASGVIGSVLASEVLHLICGHEPLATRGRALIMDMRTLDTRWIDVERDPACPVCSEPA
jgi:bacteriocin biosynthesis cyclodehydratase domain-containing protein